MVRGGGYQKFDKSSSHSRDREGKGHPETFPPQVSQSKIVSQPWRKEEMDVEGSENKSPLPDDLIFDKEKRRQLEVEIEKKLKDSSISHSWADEDYEDIDYNQDPFSKTLEQSINVDKTDEITKEKEKEETNDNKREEGTKDNKNKEETKDKNKETVKVTNDAELATTASSTTAPTITVPTTTTTEANVPEKSINVDNAKDLDKELQLPSAVSRTFFRKANNLPARGQRNTNFNKTGTESFNSPSNDAVSNAMASSARLPPLPSPVQYQSNRQTKTPPIETITKHITVKLNVEDKAEVIPVKLPRRTTT